MSGREIFFYWTFPKIISSREHNASPRGYETESRRHTVSLRYVMFIMHKTYLIIQSPEKIRELP